MSTTELQAPSSLKNRSEMQRGREVRGQLAESPRDMPGSAGQHPPRSRRRGCRRLLAAPFRCDSGAMARQLRVCVHAQIVRWCSRESCTMASKRMSSPVADTQPMVWYEFTTMEWSLLGSIVADSTDHRLVRALLSKCSQKFCCRSQFWNLNSIAPKLKQRYL